MATNIKKLRKALSKVDSGVRVPAVEAARYFRALSIHTRNVARVLEQEVFTTLEKYEEQHGSLMDSAEDEVAAAFVRFTKRASKLKSANVAEGAFEKTMAGTEVFHRKKFVASAKKHVGVDVRVLLKDEPLDKVMDAALKENVDLIKSIDGSYRARAEKIIYEGLTKGRDFQSIRQDLLDLGGFKDQYAGTETRRAKLIARDQTQKFIKSVDRMRQKHIGLTHYWWDDSGDSRVRPEHHKNDGKRFAWNKPSASGHPGDDVQCRCVARPDFSALVEE